MVCEIRCININQYKNREIINIRIKRYGEYVPTQKTAGVFFFLETALISLHKKINFIGPESAVDRDLKRLQRAHFIRLKPTGSAAGSKSIVFNPLIPTSFGEEYVRID